MTASEEEEEEGEMFSMQQVKTVYWFPQKSEQVLTGKLVTQSEQNK